MGGYNYNISLQNNWIYYVPNKLQPISVAKNLIINLFIHFIYIFILCTF